MGFEPGSEERIASPLVALFGETNLPEGAALDEAKSRVDRLLAR